MYVDYIKNTNLSSWGFTYLIIFAVNINSPFGKIYYSFITPLSPQNCLPFYLKVQTLTWFITQLILPLPLITLLLPSPLLNKTGRLHTKFTLVGYNKRAIIESTPKVG